MKHLSGEMFIVSGGKTILVHNEQEARITRGSCVYFNEKVYRITGVVAPTKPDAKWAVQIEELLPDDMYYNEKICKCFSPPTDNFVKGDVYRWTWCIDGMVAYDESEKSWAAGEIEFYQHVLFLNGK